MRLLLLSIQKLFALLLLFLAAMVLCGLFGALHDQISYSVSREYFTLFKFPQFGIDPEGGERLGAASVGFQATWWMGVPIGAMLSTIGLFSPDVRGMLRETFSSFVLVTGVTLFAGIVGLIGGLVTFISFASPAPSGWFVPRGVQRLPAFLCAGAMHNASYIGGAVGLLIAAVWLARRVSWLRRSISPAV
jgi:hypothetical protein